MKYLLLDTDVWLNLLFESGSDDNPLDIILFWVEKKEIQILLPENIVKEWNRNRSNKKKNLQKDWRKFFDHIYANFNPSKSVKSLITPVTLEALVEKQLQRIEEVFKRHTLLLPITDKIKLKAAELAELKKAPFGNKNSIGDAYIVLSLFHYLESNGINECFFITNNHTDFSHSQNKSSVHPDLEPDFIRLGIKYFVNFNRAFYELKKELPDYIAYQRLKNTKEDQKLTEGIFSPKALKDLDGVRESYLDDIKLLDVALESKNPTKIQIITVLGFLQIDPSYKEYFFKKVEHKSWFLHLKANGYFSPTENQEPVMVGKGYELPLWFALIYIDKLAEQIQHGKSLDLIDEITAIIKNVSEKPKDNHRTWYFFVQILSKLPNASVSLELLDYIPVWIGSRFDTMLQSNKICTELLPKFLNENSSKEDIQKAEKILSHILTLKKIESKEVAKQGNSFFHTSFHLNSLLTFIKDAKNIELIGKHIPLSIAYQLADNLKKLLLDYPHGLRANFTTIDGQELEIRIEIEEQNLLAYLGQLEEEEEKFSELVTIRDYELLADTEILIQIKKAIAHQGSGIQDNEKLDERLKKLLHHLRNDLSTFWCRSLTKLGSRSYDRRNSKITYTILLREMLLAKAKYQQKEVEEILSVFSNSPYYISPFFKRMLIYIVSQNWRALKSFFWDLIANDDEAGIFSDYHYDQEVRHLLASNIASFAKKEKQNLNKIIANGPIDTKEKLTEESIAYWRLKWYSALKDDTIYQKQYLILSEKLNLTNEHFDNLGEIRIRKGSESPFSVEEILKMGNQKIVEILFNFNPEDHWDGPNISGLGEVIKLAVIQNPAKFVSEIELYNGIYYFYAYHIINGFQDAWKKQCSFNWEKVLKFCLTYISIPSFGTDELRLENDGWGADQTWVIGAISNLITTGTQNDENSFDLELLPIAKEILFQLIPHLEVVHNIESTNMDYPTYSLNSSAGKTLRALLDYALIKARNQYRKNKKVKWESDVKALFESTLEKGIIDGYILQGWYFRQFHYLDKDWMVKLVQKYKDLDDQYWLPFMGGYFFENPVSDKAIFELMLPHYERVVANKLNFKYFGEGGLSRHLAILYFWEFISIEKGSLFATFLDEAELEQIRQLLHSVSTLEDYLQFLETEAEKINFQNRILKLWASILKRFVGETDEDSRLLLSNLSNLLTFIFALRKEVMELVLPSVPYLNHGYNAPHFIEHLIRLKDTDNEKDNAESISLLLKQMPVYFYMPSTVQEHMIALLTFLYNHGQMKVANEICNKYSRSGDDFLKEVYNKFNN